MCNIRSVTLQKRQCISLSLTLCNYVKISVNRFQIYMFTATLTL